MIKVGNMELDIKLRYIEETVWELYETNKVAR